MTTSALSGAVVDKAYRLAAEGLEDIPGQQCHEKSIEAQVSIEVASNSVPFAP